MGGQCRSYSSFCKPQVVDGGGQAWISIASVALCHRVGMRPAFITGKTQKSIFRVRVGSREAIAR